MLYRDAWSISNVLFKTHSSHPDVFVKFNDSKINTSRSNVTMSKWILNCRKSVGRSDANVVSYPEIVIFVGNLPEFAGNDNTVLSVSKNHQLKICEHHA